MEARAREGRASGQNCSLTEDGQRVVSVQYVSTACEGQQLESVASGFLPTVGVRSPQATMTWLRGFQSEELELRELRDGPWSPSDLVQEQRKLAVPVRISRGLMPRKASADDPRGPTNDCAGKVGCSIC